MYTFHNIRTTMETTIKKWGNSLAVRLPQHVVKKLALREGTRVDVREQKKSVIIFPAPKARLTLKERVELITPENSHEEIDWGRPQGKEVW